MASKIGPSTRLAACQVGKFLPVVLSGVEPGLLEPGLLILARLHVKHGCGKGGGEHRLV